MITQIELLNEKFFKLYGRLHENATLMTNEQVDLMQKCLLDNYKKEYELIRLEASIEEENKLFELKTKCDWFIARTWRFFFRKRANTPANIVFRNIEHSAEVKFDKQYNDLETLKRDYENEKIDKLKEFEDPDKSDELEEDPDMELPESADEG